MSWSWDNDSKEEKKEYEYKGTVTISTEEYHDLISKVYDLRNAGQKEHDDWYKEYKRAEDLEKKNEVLKSKVDLFDAWFDSDDDARAKFRLWKIQLEEDKEEN